MNTWNTITRLDYRKVSKAQAMLELICDEPNIPILESLRISGESSVTDLIVHTRLSKVDLEDRLAVLTGMLLVLERKDGSGKRHYRLNESYLNKIAGIVGMFGTPQVV